MKILMVTPYFYPAKVYGGPAFQVYLLSKELVKKGHDVTVYTSNTLKRDKNLSDKTVTKDLNGVKVVYFKNWFKKGNVFFTPGILGRRKEVQKFDLIHMHELRTFQNSFAYLTMDKNTPLILSTRGTSVFHDQHTVLKRFYDASFGKKLLKRARKIVVSSPVERDYFEDPNLLDKIVEIPNFLLSESANVKKGAFRKQHGIKEGRIALFIGRLHDKKGADFLIRAIKDLPNMRVIIAGPDEGYLHSLKKLTRRLGLDSKVTFTGLIDGMEKAEALTDCDVLVLPSFFESFGNVALEAASYGKPCIVTEDCGVSTLVKNENLGLVVPSKNVEALRKALKEMSNMKFEENKLKSFAGKLTPDKLIEKYGELYRASL